MPIVSVRDLSLAFRVPIREVGLRSAVGSLFRRAYQEIRAVHALSFALEAGQVVGFIGPNGAGKTTTLKMLSGMLHPTTGEAPVLGVVPWRRERQFLRQIAMVRGSRPIGGPHEITVLDALPFQQRIYEVSDHAFTQNMAELEGMLHLSPLVERQGGSLAAIR